MEKKNEKKKMKEKMNLMKKKKKGKQSLVEINDKIQAIIMHVVQLKYDLK